MKVFFPVLNMNASELQYFQALSQVLYLLQASQPFWSPPNIGASGQALSASPSRAESTSSQFVRPTSIGPNTKYYLCTLDATLNTALALIQHIIPLSHHGWFGIGEFELQKTWGIERYLVCTFSIHFDTIWLFVWATLKQSFYVSFCPSSAHPSTIRLSIRP